MFASFGLQSVQYREIFFHAFSISEHARELLLCCKDASVLKRKGKGDAKAN